MMFHGGGGGYHQHQQGGRFDSDDVLGKVYDSRVIAKLPKYLAPVKRWIGLGAGGMLIRTLATLAAPYLVGRATDRILGQDLGGLGIIVVFYVMVSLVTWGGQYLENVSLAYAGQSIIYRLRTQMFSHLQRLSLSFFDRNKVGKLMSRVQNDVSQIQELVTQGILTLLTSALTLVGIAAIMITMNWRVVQSLSREGENMEQFDQVNRAHLDANVTAVRLEALMMPMVQIATGVAFAIVIIVGGFQALDGAMPIGVLASFLLYVQRFFDPVLELSMQYTELQRAMASGARIFELMDIVPDIEDRPDAVEMPTVKG